MVVICKVFVIPLKQRITIDSFKSHKLCTQACQFQPNHGALCFLFAMDGWNTYIFTFLFFCPQWGFGMISAKTWHNMWFGLNSVLTDKQTAAGYIVFSAPKSL